MNPRSMVSFLENLDRQGLQGTVASNSRRRVVIDLDCDAVEDSIDNVEHSCHEYRFATLKKIQPNFTTLGLTNTSIASTMDKLTQILGGESSNVYLPGLWQTLYGQKLAVYGGMDPLTNKTVGGLQDLHAEALSNLGKVFGNTEASLDSLWQAEDWTLNFATDRLFRPVMQFTSQMQVMMDNIKNLSNKALESVVSNITAYTADVQSQMLALVDAICEKQRQVDAANANSSSSNAVLLPQMEDIINKLLDNASDVMDKLNAAQDSGNKVVDGLVDESGKLLDSGQDKAAEQARSFEQAFRDSVAKLMGTFAGLQTKYDDQYFGMVSDKVVGGTQNLTQNILREKSRLANFTSSFNDKFAQLKHSMADKLAAVALGQRTGFNSVDDSLTMGKNNATQLVASLDSHRRMLQALFASAETQIGSNLNATKQSVISTLQASQQDASDTLSGITNNMGAANAQLASTLDSARSQLSDAVASTKLDLAESGFTQASLVGGQISTLTKAGYLGDGQLSTAKYGTQLAVSTGLEATQTQVDGIGGQVGTLASAVTGSIDGARASLMDAQAASSESFQNAWSETEVAGKLSASQGYAQLAGNNSLIEANVERGRSAMGMAQTTLASAQVQASGLVQAQADLERTSREQISGLASVLADTASAASDQMQRRLTSGVGAAGSQWASAQAQAVTGMDVKIRERVTGPLTSVAGALGKVNGGDVILDPSKNLKSAVMAVNNIANAVSALMASEQVERNRFLQPVQSTINSTRTQLNSAGNNFLDKLPGVAQEGMEILGEFVEDQTKAVGQRSDQLLARWDPSLPMQLDAKISKDVDMRIPGLMHKVSTANDSFQASVGVAEQTIAALGHSVADLSRSAPKTVAGIASALETEVNNHIDGFMRILNGNESVVADELTRMMEEYEAEHQREEARAMDAKLHAENLAKSNYIQFPGEALDGVINSVSDQGNQVQRSQEASLGRVASVVVNASDMMGPLQQLIASSPDVQNRIKDQLRRATVDGSEALRAIALAVDVANKTLVNGQSTAEMSTGFLLQSGEAQAESIGMLSDGSVDAVAKTVADTQVGLLDIMQSISAGYARAQRAIDETAELSQTGTDALDGASGAQQSLLSQNLTADQLAYRMQLGQVRNFVRKVAGAWGNYTDYEWRKFESMGDQDRVNLEFLKNLANNGLGQANDTISQVESQLGEVNANWTDFGQESGRFAEDITGKVTRELERMSELQNDAKSKFQDIKHAMETQPSGNVSEATAAETAFERGIDSTVSQVMQATLVGG